MLSHATTWDRIRPVSQDAEVAVQARRLFDLVAPKRMELIRREMHAALLPGDAQDLEVLERLMAALCEVTG